MTQTETAIMPYERLDQRELDIYRRQFVPSTTTDDEWTIFVEMCRTYQLSPMRRQMYLIARYDYAKKRSVSTPQISIGGLRALAQRTNEFEGTTEPQWADEEGNWYTCWPKAKGAHPYAARIGIYRRGFRAPVWGIRYFHEVAQRKQDKSLTKFWDEQGLHMLVKCAEADGLRKAFEEQCGGVYIHEEMNQADTDSPVVSIIPVVDASDTNTNEALRETETARATSQPTNGAKPVSSIQTQKPAHDKKVERQFTKVEEIPTIDALKAEAKEAGIKWVAVLRRVECDGIAEDAISPEKCLLIAQIIKAYKAKNGGEALQKAS